MSQRNIYMLNYGNLITLKKKKGNVKKQKKRKRK